MALSQPNFLSGNTPRPGQPISTKSFGSLSSASTAARTTVTPLQPGVQAAGGSVAFPAAARPIASPAPAAPFQISARTKPGSPGDYQYKVNLQSDLMLSIAPNDWQAITGLDTWYDLANTTPLTFAGGSGPGLPTGFYCYDIITLYISIASMAATGAFIQNRVNGSNDFDPTLPPWDPSDLACVTNDGGTPPSMTGINFLLGYTVQPTSAGTAPPTVIQCCSNHLVLENISINGFAGIYPFPAVARRFGRLAT